MSAVADKLGLIYLKLEAEGHHLAGDVKDVLVHLKDFVTGEGHKVKAEAEQVAADTETALAPVGAEVKADASELGHDVASEMSVSDADTLVVSPAYAAVLADAPAPEASVYVAPAEAAPAVAE